MILFWVGGKEKKKKEIKSFKNGKLSNKSPNFSVSNTLLIPSLCRSLSNNLCSCLFI